MIVYEACLNLILYDEAKCMVFKNKIFRRTYRLTQDSESQESRIQLYLKVHERFNQPDIIETLKSR